MKNKGEKLYYKGYEGSVVFSEPDQIFCGKVLNICALVSYEGKTLEELEKDFQEGIEEYLKYLKSNQSYN